MTKQVRIPNKVSQSATLVQHQSTITVGPIPPASTLEEYRSVRADLPDLIIEEWLKEAESRRAFTSKEFEITERNAAFKEKISSDLNRLEYARLFLGGLFYFGSLWVAWQLASNNHLESAIAIAALPVVAAIAGAGIKIFRSK